MSTSSSGNKPKAPKRKRVSTSSRKKNVKKTTAVNVVLDEGPLDTMAQRWIAARQSVGLTPAQLAEKLNITRSAVSRIEQGHGDTLRSKTAFGMETVTHHRAQWIITGEAPRYVSEELNNVQTRKALFTLTAPELKSTLLASLDEFSKDDLKAILVALIDHLSD